MPDYSVLDPGCFHNDHHHRDRLFFMENLLCRTYEGATITSLIFYIMASENCNG